MAKWLISFIIMCLLALLSCRQQNNPMNIDDINLFQKKINIPYNASGKRVKVILDNMNKLKKGMAVKQVIELLTAPDEVNLTYKLVKSKSEENTIGFSLVYILKRRIETGSINEKDEKLLRIHFNDSKKLIWAYAIGIDSFKTIEEE
ncbi:hypothetical protein Q4Q35_10535 [Flavivirga aquimarina]|uniref:Lipoprotein n=1 Tax=Flavivirga aquimarina TaxID=2027862 RepID=A0ABT8WAT3_9FLAO|nr:hypothetical protein [Flavivirga aquimarina]MDO5970244.1 hypothetical protein [Flavivirga aquimarina]